MGNSFETGFGTDNSAEEPTAGYRAQALKLIPVSKQCCS